MLRHLGRRLLMFPFRAVLPAGLGTPQYVSCSFGVVGKNVVLVSLFRSPPPWYNLSICRSSYYPSCVEHMGNHSTHVAFKFLHDTPLCTTCSDLEWSFCPSWLSSLSPACPTSLSCSRRPLTCSASFQQPSRTHWRFNLHRGALKNLFPQHFSWMSFFKPEICIDLNLCYIFIPASLVGGPGTTGHHNRLCQAGLAPLSTTVLHPRTKQGDSAETGRTLLSMQLLWGCELWCEKKNNLQIFIQPQFWVDV